MFEPWLIIGIFVVAAAYSMVGHGGASGYLALLAFTAIPAQQGSTTALMLNLVVSGITFVSFRRAQQFRWKLAWPFLLTSIPLAFVGGRMKVESQLQNGLLAVVLLYAAIALAFPVSPKAEEPRDPQRAISLGTGGVVGLLSGIVGVGGGIFLSPLLILLNWARPHQVAALSSVFIFCNSLAGLIARPTSVWREGLSLWPLAIAGAFGALLGSAFGANRTTGEGLRRALAAVLLLAVWKLITRALGI